ncbi:hypothetical protein H4R18_000234 [Coemansia javaensis]|uniref:Uncharacterized protein n=1 Tax=Coemansia javaensis TaxID=2761396 RepID=A0A9W8LN27_9FUNG|nr:hypothetical protein H4R18_000234 [Coemansia javaensis]
MAAKKRMLGWDGVDAADHETDIQAICSDIIAAIPEVRFLAVILKSPDSVTQELTRRLAVHYSGQLEDLAIAGPVAIPRGRKFKQLKRLGLNYDYISTSRVAPALLRVIDEVVGIPAARQFTLMVPRGFGDDPAVLAVVGRIFEKAHKCETRELVAPDNASPLLVDMVASAPVTHLTLHMASMGVVTDMIRRTSSVTTLSIIRLNTDSAQPDILAPSPDGGHTVEPLNTSITELCLGWYPVEWHPDAVLAAKCLLLAIPSLLRLVASDALIQQLAEFTNARSTCYPYRPNPSPYSRWWLA